MAEWLRRSCHIPFTGALGRNSEAKTNLLDPVTIDKVRLQNCFTASSLGLPGAVMTGEVLTVGTGTIVQAILTVWSMNPHTS